MCSKIKHETAAAADRHRRQLEARDLRRGVPYRAGHLNCYECEICGAGVWHVGHRRKKRKDIVQ